MGCKVEDCCSEESAYFGFGSIFCPKSMAQKRSIAVFGNFSCRQLDGESDIVGLKCRLIQVGVLEDFDFSVVFLQGNAPSVINKPQNACSP